MERLSLFEKVLIVILNLLGNKTHIPGHKSWKDYFEKFLPMSDVLLDEVLRLCPVKDNQGARIVKKNGHKGVKLTYLKGVNHPTVQQMLNDAPMWTSILVETEIPFKLSYGERYVLNENGMGDYIACDKETYDYCLLPKNERGTKVTKALVRLLKKLEWESLDYDRVDEIYRDYINTCHTVKGTIYITGNYSDMLLSSTGRGWTSCYSIDGYYARSTVSSWENGDMLAVFIKDGSIEWNARLILRNSIDGYWCEPKVYGDGSIPTNDMIKMCDNWLKEKDLLSTNKGVYHPDFEGYSDYKGTAVKRDTFEQGEVSLPEEEDFPHPSQVVNQWDEGEDNVTVVREQLHFQNNAFDMDC